MTANDAWIIYKRIDDEIQAQEILPQRYFTYELKDQRKLQIFQTLVDSNVDIHKFFLANCVLNKEFYVDSYKHHPEKCMTLYYSWDEFLKTKRDEYFYRVIIDLKKGLKLNLMDRDKFLELITITDPLLWSTLYPEDLELLQSLETDWVKFNLPEYTYSMDYIKKVIRGNMVLRRMKSYDKLKQKTLLILKN